MNQKALELYKKISSDSNLKEKFKNVKSEEELFKMIKDLGYDLTKEDIVVSKSADGTEMDMQELEKVSGAGGCGCVGGGYGEGSNSLGAFKCACAVTGIGGYRNGEVKDAGSGLCVCIVAGGGATNDPNSDGC